MSAKNEQKDKIKSDDKEEIVQEDEKEAKTEDSSEELKNEKEPVNQKELEIEELMNRIKALEDENTELKNQYLRKQADFENFRKRMFREKEDSVKYANSNLLSDLLSTIDDFERAIKSSEESKDFDSFHSGIVLIEKELVNMLERKWGLTRFDDLGEDFDPQKHEALMMEESDKSDVPVVLEVFQKGYLLNDRVIRPAKVKVSKPADNDSEEISEDSKEEVSNEDSK